VPCWGELPHDGEMAVDENPNDPTSGSTLPRLIEIEQRIEAVVAQAESDAARRVEAASEEIRAAREDPEATGAAALEALRNAVAKESEETIRAIDEQAMAEVERYRRVDDRVLSELARWVATRVAGEGPAE